MKCPECDGTGKVVHPMMSMNGDEYTGEWEQHECEMCGGGGVVAPLTEEEYIQSCDTEQLAEWICSVHEKCYYCGAKRVPDREHCPFGDGKCRNNKHEFAMWLKQPHR